MTTNYQLPAQSAYKNTEDLPVPVLPFSLAQTVLPV